MLLTNDWTEILLRLGLGTLIGMGLGFDREWRGFDAGLRTHGLVSLSSAMLTVSSLMMFEELHRLGGESDPLRVIQGLAQAIGFIAGGLIFVRGRGVMNMTTAASLWTACAAGIAAGAGQFALLGIASAMALALLTLLGFVERYMPHAEEASSGNGDEKERATKPRRKTEVRPSKKS